MQQLEGKLEAAISSLSTAAALADEISDAKNMLNSHMRLGALYFNLGRLQEAQQEFERSIELAREQGSLRFQSWVTAFLGLIRFHCGPRAEAEDSTARVPCDGADERPLHAH